MCFDFLYNFCLKHPSFLSSVNETFNFLDSFFFSKNAQISNFMTIRPVGAELLHEYKRTDGHDEANIRFSKLCGSA